MSTIPPLSAALSGAPLGLAASSALATESGSVDELIRRIKSDDETVRAAAWQEAGPLGAAAVKPLAGVLSTGDLEVARSAKRALWKIVHQAGRPGAETESRTVTAELLSLLSGSPVQVCREVLWMIAEIGGPDAVQSVAALLANAELREDARATLERIPGEPSLAALKAGLETVAEDFKPAIAHSLRVRGVQVQGYPDQKLRPTRPKPATPPANL